MPLSHHRHPRPRSVAALLAVASCAAVAASALPATPASAAAASVAAVGASTFSWPSGSGTTYFDSSAAGQVGRLTWSNATGTSLLTAPADGSALVVRAKGDQCAGAPVMQVALDGQSLGTVTVSATSWTAYRIAGTVAAGAHNVALSFVNDIAGNGCDRNLRLDTVDLVAPTAAPTATPPPTSPATPPASAPAPGNPLAGLPLFVDPVSDAGRTAAGLRTYDPAGAALFDKIAQTPVAHWVGDWVPATQVQAYVAGRVAAAGGSVPELVVYAIPHRDCGSYSSGGLPDAAAYHDWVGRFAAGLGTHRAVVVVEPDALPQLDCLSGADQQARLAMFRDAAALLAAAPGATVYLDAGNSRYKTVGEMETRLRSAGVDRVRGFSLNVSNFNPTPGELTYGDALSSALGGTHFVVDTSRNGRGPASTWCNPPDQALGARPTTATGDARADALLWLKRVGESDGPCNGGPPPGTWWPDYARGLAARAAW